MKKRYIVAALCLGLVLSGCGATNENTNNAENANQDTVAVQENEAVDSTEETVAGEAVEESTPAKEAIPLADIYAEISSQVSLKAPMEASEDFIFNYYGIDVSTLEEYVFVLSEDATSAETIIMMKSEDGDQIANMKKSLEMLLEDKAYEMEDYLPDQYEVVKKSQVKTSGDYIWLVISESEENISAIIEKYL